MKTMFLKELRENSKWALLIFCGLCICIYQSQRTAGPLFLFAEQVQISVMIVGAIAGLLMGGAQTFFETRPDNWAFVVHRPVPRLGIFLAKSAAGLLLLYTALGLPCALAVAWGAQPGNLSVPFQARMVLPAIADTLAAGAYYFAGTLLVMRSARWLGTRLLPLGLALLCSVLTFRDVPQFWQAALIILGVQIISAIAAWGAFSDRGEIDAPIPRVALAVMLLAGAMAVVPILYSIPDMFANTARWQQDRVDQDGNVVRIRSALEDNQVNYLVSDLAGVPLPQYQGFDLGEPASAARFPRLSNLSDERYYPWILSTMADGGGYRSPNDGLILLRNVAPPGVRLRTMHVYNVPRHIIELYDPMSHSLVGTIGPAGFSQGHTTPAEFFQGDPLNANLQPGNRALAFPSAVYLMELQLRSVRPIFIATADDPIFAAVQLDSQKDSNIAVATQKHLHLIRPTGEVVFSIPMNWQSDGLYFQTAAAIKDHLLLWRTTGDDRLHSSICLEFASDGHLMRRTVVPPLGALPGVRKVHTAIFGFMYPLALRPIIPLWMNEFIWFDLETRYYSSLFLGMILAGAAVSAVITLLLCRRYGFSSARIAGWIVLNLLLGMSGIVVLLGLSDCPAREKCPACAGQRIAGSRQCSQCSAPLPSPQLDGREIFEPADALEPAT